MKLCIFGAASNEIDNEYIKEAEVFGELMAKRGHSLVFGAGKNGMMGGCARGAAKGNVEICGVIPSFFKEESIEQIFDKCTDLIFTETMAERKTKMEDLADAFVILPGGIGTFEEMFEVLTLKQLGRHTKPIAIFNIKKYYKNLEELLQNSFRERFIRDDCRKLYFCSEDPEEVLSYLENDSREAIDVHILKNG
ncbi:MAG: TIGR00730 family Rossman fold protein [Clostridia bacterium]|nr:TIGR00730 family Rossman fold protein [Clostridia bacterium]